MRNKKITVLLCAGLFICMSVFLCTQAKADDAFVVEEEVIIGGENVQEGEGQVTPAVQPSEVSPPAVQELPRDKEEEKPAEISEQEAEASVSQNCQTPVFHVPLRRNETKAPEEKGDDKALQPPDSEDEQEKEELSEAVQSLGADNENMTEQENPSATADRKLWWMLAAGGVFFLGGCVRILWRIKGRKG